MPVCVVPEPGACSASQELPSRYDAPNTCTVHVVMHSQLRWRARAHGADERTRLRRLLEEFSLIVVKIYSIRMASAEKVK